MVGICPRIHPTNIFQKKSGAPNTWFQIQVGLKIPGFPLATLLGEKGQCCTCNLKCWKYHLPPIQRFGLQRRHAIDYQRIQAALLRAMERNIFLWTDILNVTLVNNMDTGILCLSDIQLDAPNQS